MATQNIDLSGITDLGQFPEQLQAEVPRQLVEQYNNKQTCFGIPAKVFQSNKVRVSIENPKRVFSKDGEVVDVQFIIRFFGVMDDEGYLVPLSKDGRGDTGRYLRGFRSNLQSAQKWVEQEILTESDKSTLVEYATRFEDMGDEAYDTTVRDDGRSNSKDRVYLVPRTGVKSAGIIFNLVLRRNPVDNSYAVGIELLGASGLQLIGQGITNAVGDISNDITMYAEDSARKPLTVNYALRKAAPTPAARNGRVAVGVRTLTTEPDF